MFVAENFIRSLVSKYGRHTVYTDGGTWYDEVYNIIGLKHYLYSSTGKSLMERVNQFLKDRQALMTIVLVLEEECNLFYVHNWIQFFVSMYNDTLWNNNDNFLLNEVNIILN